MHPVQMLTHSHPECKSVNKSPVFFCITIDQVIIGAFCKHWLVSIKIMYACYDRTKI